MIDSTFDYRFFEREDFEYVEMDTDSAYMALAGRLDDLVIASKRDTYYEEIEKWFPRPFCSKHRASYVEVMTGGNRQWKGDKCCRDVTKFDCRTPGLFKTEFEGDGIVALNSKTYFCWSNEANQPDKYSSKGLSKRTNTLTKENFLKVLNEKTLHSGTNTGFVRKDGTTYTYSQTRTGLNYMYAKRSVHADGVSTSPIDL